TFAIPLPAQLVGAQPIAGAALVLALAFLVVLVRAPDTSHEPVAVTVGWRAMIRGFRRQVQSLSTARRFIMAMLVSAGVWALQIMVFAIVARAVGITLPLAGTVAAILLTNTGLVLRATPGNVGFFQFAYAVAAAHFGVP